MTDVRSDRPTTHVTPSAPIAQAASGSLVGGLVRTARPRQWLKNLLVLAAPAAAGVLDSVDALARTLLAFAAFSLAASGTYLVNDAVDVVADRRHPRKRHRPVAAGRVPVRLARWTGIAGMAAGLGVAALTGGWVLPAVVLGYLVVTTSYSVWLKHVVVLELVLVASGFVLRALAGAAAVDVRVSRWFFIVASLGSLLVVTGKREAELRSPDSTNTRRSLEGYPAGYLAHVRGVAAGALVVTYCLWAFERDGAAGSALPMFAFSIVPFVCGVLRYALLVERGHGEQPEELLIGDRALLACGAATTLLVLVGTYAG